MRLRVTGETSLHQELCSHAERWINEIRAVATDTGGGHAWIEKILIDTTPSNDTLATDDGPLGELVQTLRQLPNDSVELESLGQELKQFKNALPLEARHEQQLDSEDLQGLLNNVEALLPSRLNRQAAS